MTPHDALKALISASPIRPIDAPAGVAGLYLLHDHQEVPRYIGKTTDLRRRILSNHCAGDLNSHKWVAAFNAGRLWHDRKNPLSHAADGKLAKQLRAELARTFCRARILCLPNISAAELGSLETAVRAIAPDPMNDWNDQKAIPAAEPVELVDRLLDALGWDNTRRAALERQSLRWPERAVTTTRRPTT